MRRILALPALAAFALSACSGAGDEASGEGISAEDAAEAASEVARPTPGQYKSTIELIDFQVPGMPQQQVDMVKGMMTGAMAEGNEFCLTREEADKGWQTMVDEMAEAKCTYQKFETSGNSIDVEATCMGENNQAGTLKLTGTTGATSSSMTMEMEQAVADLPGEGKVRMKMKVDSLRTGDCA